MKTKVFLFIIVASICLILFAARLVNNNMKASDIPGQTHFIDTLRMNELPDITRIEGIGIKNGYAYFLYRKGTKNYLGRMKTEEAIEITGSE